MAVARFNDGSHTSGNTMKRVARSLQHCGSGHCRQEQHSQHQLQEGNERRKPQVDLVSEQSKTNGLTSFVVWLKKMLAGYHQWKISLS